MTASHRIISAGGNHSYVKVTATPLRMHAQCANHSSMFLFWTRTASAGLPVLLTQHSRHWAVTYSKLPRYATWTADLTAIPASNRIHVSNVPPALCSQESILPTVSLHAKLAMSQILCNACNVQASAATATWMATVWLGCRILPVCHVQVDVHCALMLPVWAAQLAII